MKFYGTFICDKYVFYDRQLKTQKNILKLLKLTNWKMYHHDFGDRAY